MSELRDRLDEAWDQSLHGQIMHTRLATANERRVLAVRHANQLANQLAETQTDRDRAEWRASVYEFWTNALFLLFLLAVTGVAG